MARKRFNFPCGTGKVVSQLVSGGLLVSAFLIQTGCLPRRSEHPVPDVPLPGQYRNTLVTPTSPTPAPEVPGDPTVPEITPEPPAPPLPPDGGLGLTEWWHSFGSDELEGLIDRGMANNADVRMSTLRIVQAKARADQAGAGRLPSISMPLIAATQYPNTGATVGTAPTANGGSSGSGGSSSSSTQDTVQAYVRGDYRLDVWGEQRNMVESAGLQLWRAAFERDNIKRNMAASLASYYLEYVALNDRLRVAKETETVLAATLATIEKRVAAGDATLSELEQQRAAIFSLRASIPTMEQQREDDINSIAFMVGTVPGSLTLSQDGLDSLSLPRVLPGLPSSLLLRRPDVRMAEARLLAADADLDIARARILPPVDLSAQIGYSSLTLSQLFLPQALFWNTVTNLTVNIFDNNKRQNEKVFNQAIKEEMVESYVRALYQAMREVESALATIRLAEKRLAAQKETVDASRRAWDISTKIYAVGGIDYLTLLETERSYHRYLDEYQRIRMDQYRGYVSLFQALGGGVAPSEKLPGKGKRPQTTPEAAPTVARADKAGRANVAGEGIGWGDGRSLQVENFWQVEITGLYDRTTIGSVWRDLRTRYPVWMEGRLLRPRLQGRIDDNDESQESWYRLYVAKFDSPGLAAGFCATLNASQQRCRVVSSRSDDTVEVAAADIRMLDIPPVTETPLSETSNSVEKSPSPTVDPAPVVEVQAGDPTPLSVPTAIPRDVALRPKASRKALRPQRAARTKVVPVVASEPREKLAYAVQLGAFANRENAALTQEFWKQKAYDVYVSENRDADQRPIFVVRTGVFTQRREAATQAQALRRKEMVEVLVVPMMVDKQGKPSVIELGDPATADTSSMPPAVPELPEAADALTTQSPLATASVSPGSNGVGDKGSKSDKSSTPAPVYALQLGAFSSQDNAKVALNFWNEKGYSPYINEIRDADGRQWYALRSGRFTQRREALVSAKTFGRNEGTPVTVVLLRAPVKETGTTPSATPNTVPDVPSSTGVSPAQLLTPKVDDMPMPDATAGEAPPAGKSVSEVAAPPVNMVQLRASADPRNSIVGGDEFAPLEEDAPPLQHGAYTVQLAAFAKPENAARALTEWERRGYPAYVVRLTDTRGNLRYALRTGNFSGPKAAQSVLKTLDRKARRVARLTMVGIEDADRMSPAELSELN